MIINGNRLLAAKPIRNMVDTKVREHGVSYGLGEAGYDIRIKQDITFLPHHVGGLMRVQVASISDGKIVQANTSWGRFTIASAMEEFDMPPHVTGIVHDKSTWARQGLSVFNTVIEPGWKGFLTLELIYHGNDALHIPAGAGIAQVIFHEVWEPAEYTGKYQNQEDRPVEARG
ncbi:putative dCTP deaminase [Burkholderia phage vB_BpP_HN03]